MNSGQSGSKAPPSPPAPKPSNGYELVVQVGYFKLKYSVAVSHDLQVEGRPAKYPITGGDLTTTWFVHRSGPYNDPPLVVATIKKSGHVKNLRVWCRIEFAGHTQTKVRINEAICTLP
jgi:hypothetical protein